MGHHIQIDGQFKNDKYDWCPTGFFALKITDPNGELAFRACNKELHDRHSSYDWRQPEFIILNFKDPRDELALRAYAQETDNIELSKDILQGLENVKEKKLEDLKNE